MTIQSDISMISFSIIFLIFAALRNLLGRRTANTKDHVSTYQSASFNKGIEDLLGAMLKDDLYGRNKRNKRNG